MHRFLAPVFLVALLLAACGDETEPAHHDHPIPAPAAAVEVRPDGGRLPADGASAYELRLQLRDGAGRPMAGVPVELEVTGSGTKVVPPGATDAQGSATATVASTVAGTQVARFYAPLDGLRTQVGRTLYLSFGPGGAAALFFDRAPAAVHAGIEFSVRVGSLDASGNVASDPIEVTLAAEGATLVGPTTAVAGANGFASFPSLRIDRAARDVVLVASAEGFEPIRSAPFDVVAGGAAAIAWTTQPAAAVAGERLLPVEVTLRDAQGNLVEGRVPVTLSVAGGVAPLLGTTTVAASNGVARFDQLRVERAGHFRLEATVEGVAPVASAPFDVVPAAPAAASSAITVAPAARPAGEAATAGVLVRDAFGNGIPGAAVAFEVGGDGNEILDADVTTDASGLARLTFRSTVAERKTVSATVADFTLAAEVTFLPGLPDRDALVIEGADQAGTVGAFLAEPIVLTVNDALGNPVPGLALAFSTADEGGVVDPAEVFTDEAGVASVTWKLGTVAGAQRLAVAVEGWEEPVLIAATAVAGAPATLAAVGGDAQTGTAGSALPLPLQALVKDAWGNPVAGAEVTFAADAGSGRIDPAIATTDAAGVASATWTLGTAAGAHAVEASIGGLPPVRFGATALAGPAQALVAVAGDGQSGAVGTTLAQPLQVRVEDAHGNPVAGASVSFAVVEGGGSLQPAQVATDAAGLASATWTLGTAAGAHAAEASIAGLPPVRFGATALAGPAQALVAVAGDGQSGTVGTTLAQPLQVRVEDAHGNPVAGASVSFVVVEGGGTVGTPTAIAGGDGVAETSFTLGTAAGAHAVEARLGALPAIRFQASAEPDSPAALTKVSGDGQSVDLGQSVLLSVQVTDAHGNLVPGAAVDFAGPVGAGTVTPTRAIADAAGVATARWAAATAGTHAVTATVGAVSATFTVVTRLQGSLVRAAGNGAVGLLGSMADVPLVARLVDAQGSGVPGVEVEFEVTDGAATLAELTSITDTAGYAWTWVTPTGAGPVTVSASAAGYRVDFEVEALPRVNQLGCHFQPGAGIHTWDGAAIHWAATGVWRLLADWYELDAIDFTTEVQFRAEERAAGVPALSSAVTAAAIRLKSWGASGGRNLRFHADGTVEVDGTVHPLAPGGAVQIPLAEGTVDVTRMSATRWHVRYDWGWTGQDEYWITESEGTITSIVSDLVTTTGWTMYGLCGDNDENPANDAALIAAEVPRTGSRSLLD